MAQKLLGRGGMEGRRHRAETPMVRAVYERGVNVLLNPASWMVERLAIGVGAIARRLPDSEKPRRNSPPRRRQGKPEQAG